MKYSVAINVRIARHVQDYVKENYILKICKMVLQNLVKHVTTNSMFQSLNRVNNFVLCNVIKIIHQTRNLVKFVIVQFLSILVEEHVLENACQFYIKRNYWGKTILIGRAATFLERIQESLDSLEKQYYVEMTGDAKSVGQQTGIINLVFYILTTLQHIMKEEKNPPKTSLPCALYAIG